MLGRVLADKWRDENDNEYFADSDGANILLKWGGGVIIK